MYIFCTMVSSNYKMIIPIQHILCFKGFTKLFPNEHMQLVRPSKLVGRDSSGFQTGIFPDPIWRCQELNLGPYIRNQWPTNWAIVGHYSLHLTTEGKGWKREMLPRPSNVSVALSGVPTQTRTRHRTGLHQGKQFRLLHQNELNISIWIAIC